jgi:hypothetical protein
MVPQLTIGLAPKTIGLVLRSGSRQRRPPPEHRRTRRTRPTTRTSLSHIERTARTSLEALTVRTAYPQLSAPKRKSKIGFYDDDNMVPE